MLDVHTLVKNVARLSTLEQFLKHIWLFTVMREHLFVDFTDCDKTSKLAQTLNKHEVTHNGLKPFKCEICETY